MEKKYCVYMHRNKINNKIYVGQTCTKPEYRWRNGEGYKTSSHFYNSIKKYGWNNFEHIILKDGLSLQEADFWECYYIDLYNTTNQDKGYNLRGGGHKGFLYTEKAIKSANANKSYKMGEEHPNSKKVKCKETGDVFGSIADACRWCNSTKVYDCVKGHRSHAGKHPQTGILLSWRFADKNEKVTIACHDKKIDKKKNPNIICVNNGMIFETAASAAEWYSGKKSNATCVLRCCRGERKSAGIDKYGNKLKWKFLEE